MVHSVLSSLISSAEQFLSPFFAFVPLPSFFVGAKISSLTLCKILRILDIKCNNSKENTRCQ